METDGLQEMGNTARKRKAKLPRKRVTPPPAPEPPQFNLKRETLTLSLIVLGVFLLLSLYSHTFGRTLPLEEPGEIVALSQSNMMGHLGSQVADLLVSLLGWCSFVTVLWAFLLARRVWVGESTEQSFFTLVTSIVGSVVMVSAAAAFVSVLYGYEGGGAIGGTVAYHLIPFVNEAGTVLITFAVFILAMGISTGIGTEKIVAFISSIFAFIRSVIVDTWFLLKKMFGGIVFATQRGAVSTGRGVYAGSKAVLRGGKGPLKLLASLPVACLQLFKRSEKAELVEEEPAKPKRRKRKPTPFKEDAAEDTEIVVSRRQDIVDVAAKTKKGRAGRARQAKKQKLRNVNGKIVPAGPAGSRPKRVYELPALDLLVAGEESFSGAPKDSELVQNSKRLERTLADFRIGGKIVEVQPGPVITLYHFSPAAGVKVQRVVTLADDIALALKVASVRVFAPVEGKGTVGIEVPNANREVVRLRNVLGTPEYEASNVALPIAVGKDTFGDPFVADLARMPHLLIAGATGSGKSVCINSIILSLIYRNTPDQLRMILIDPKMLELSVYEDIPHLKAPVVTQPKRARGALWWAVEEMERRYQLMKDVGARNLAGYNELVAGKSKKRKGQNGATAEEVIELEEEDVIATGAPELGLDRTLESTSANGSAEPETPEPLPQIVIVVDEMADLMLSVGREIEELLTRLAQKARAAGIHLILATQRPSVNVITGLIKANFPARISFKVASRIDSRTILDASGAERLLGHGDMLFFSPSHGNLKRLHSAFVSDKEVHDVVASLREQGPPEFDTAIEEMITKMEESEKGVGIDGRIDEEYDPLYDQAVQLVIDKGQASTSMVQRAFRIGYNRAARILETMEHEGVVGEADGSKPRQVLVPARD